MSFTAQNTTFDRLISFLNAAIVIDFVISLTGLRVLYKQNQSNLDSYLGKGKFHCRPEWAFKRYKARENASDSREWLKYCISLAQKVARVS